MKLRIPSLFRAFGTFSKTSSPSSCFQLRYYQIRGKTMSCNGDPSPPKRMKGVYSMGPKTLDVPMELFQLNRKRLCDSLTSEGIDENVLVFLQGGDSQPFYDTDIEYNVFRQEPFFFWTFGVTDPGCYGAIHLPTRSAYLFVPRESEEAILWLGKLPTLQGYKEKYEVENVHFIDEMVSVMKPLSTTLLTLNGVNSDSGLRSKEVCFDGIEQFKVNKDTLYEHITECRVIKTELEKEVMRYVARISSEAHKTLMRKAKPGIMEYQCESIFTHYTYHVGGCRHVAYTCICASGDNGSVLHYGHASKPNDKIINDGEMCTFDMGSVYCGYSADITVSFPVNGKFTEDQKSIYNAVLEANLAVQKAAKPGVSWRDMHLLSYKVMLTNLKKIGILKGDVDEMIEAGIGAVFQPHGLGHLLGLDVHDVGGYIKGTPKRPTEPGFRCLRTARNLEAGMALTIEPGCYFIESVLDKALKDPVQSRYFDAEVLKRFRGFGGVRIEDDVFVTENGIENYTQVPRTVEEIEDWMSKKDDSFGLNGV
ncbi:xaa-Pro dipeptidase [Planococcus citri]|uniref:xaa-Pro dipeptidase n=1 Tax=Planococcus citri TaxID=170843 RepID=UPI0031F92ED8